MSESVLPMFSSRSFIVSGLTFRSLIHFEFIFVYGVRKCSSFILLKKYGTLHEFACHPCAGAMLIFSVSFQFLVYMLPKQAQKMDFNASF